MSTNEVPPASAPISLANEVRVGVGLEPRRSADAELLAATEETVLPLYAEQIVVARNRSERKVQVRLHTLSREHPVDELLTHERVEIERVPIGRPVDAIPADRQEGDATIIPVVEEVVVIHRQLILKEEIRMRRVRITEHHRETVSLREQEATVERDQIAAVPASNASTPAKSFAS